MIAFSPGKAQSFGGTNARRQCRCRIVVRMSVIAVGDSQGGRGMTQLMRSDKKRKSFGMISRLSPFECRAHPATIHRIMIRRRRSTNREFRRKRLAVLGAENLTTARTALFLTALMALTSRMGTPVFRGKPSMRPCSRRALHTCQPVAPQFTQALRKHGRGCGFRKGIALFAIASPRHLE